jgi:hypothetical protein
MKAKYMTNTTCRLWLPRESKPRREVDQVPQERLSISLAQLRAELTALELRIVDRMNTAVARKADESAFTPIAALATANTVRLTALEAVRIDVTRIEAVEKDVSDLQSIAGYKKWLWAQTVALVAIAVAIFGLAAERV